VKTLLTRQRRPPGPPKVCKVDFRKVISPLIIGSIGPIEAIAISIDQSQAFVQMPIQPAIRTAGQNQIIRCKIFGDINGHQWQQVNGATTWQQFNVPFPTATLQIAFWRLTRFLGSVIIRWTYQSPV
jgi:hypothetical protein